MKPEGLFRAFSMKEMRFENAKTRTIIFNAPLPESDPGQFVMAWLPGLGEKPFSISGNDPLALTIADVGPVSHALIQLREGERVWIRGPFGRGFSLVSQSHLLVGGGYGAAPLSFLARQARLQGHTVTVALGARTKNDLIMTSAFELMGCQVYLATEDGSAGIQGLVTDVLEQACANSRPGSLYACGPNGMLVAVAEFALKQKMPAQISFEALIRCGVGLCGSCELPEETCLMLGIPSGFLVCRDGPVAVVD